MLITKLLITVILLMMFTQDIRSRSIVWPLFPLLALSGFSLQILLKYPALEILQFSVVNVLFLMVQFFCIKLYFAVTKRSGVKIIDHLIGWGDIIFLCCTAFVLPSVTFFFYYAGSLLIVLVIWSLYRLFPVSSGKHVPLAGLQALILLAMAFGDWLFRWYDLYDDNLFTSLVS